MIFNTTAIRAQQFISYVGRNTLDFDTRAYQNLLDDLYSLDIPNEVVGCHMLGRSLWFSNPYVSLYLTAREGWDIDRNQERIENRETLIVVDRCEGGFHEDRWLTNCCNRDAYSFHLSARVLQHLIMATGTVATVMYTHCASEDTFRISTATEENSNVKVDTRTCSA